MKFRTGTDNMPHQELFDLQASNSLFAPGIEGLLDALTGKHIRNMGNPSSGTAIEYACRNALADQVMEHLHFTLKPE